MKEKSEAAAVLCDYDSLHYNLYSVNYFVFGNRLIKCFMKYCLLTDAFLDFECDK